MTDAHPSAPEPPSPAGFSPAGPKRVRPRFEFLEADGPIAFAHRGGAAEKPENTWASFTHARDLGYRYMETDVRATRDGIAVAFHDPDLARTGGRPERIAELSWKELSRVELDGGERVPRLDDLLAAWPEVRWNIDAKHDSVVAPLAQAIKTTGAASRVCVTSFSDWRLERLKRTLGPRQCSAMGPAAVLVLRLASLASPPPFAEPAARLALGLTLGRYGAVQVPVAYRGVRIVDSRFISAAHRAGLQVHVWTIDDEEEMDRLLDLGVDGLMTDRPTVLKQVLRRRGAW